MNEMTIDTRLILATYFRDRRGETENRPQIALASERFRAIDLSCRACGAMAMGAGLGFPVGVSAPLRFHPQPPIFVTRIAPWETFTFRSPCRKHCNYYKTKLRLIRRLGVGDLSQSSELRIALIRLICFDLIWLICFVQCKFECKIRSDIFAQFNLLSKNRSDV